MAESDTRDVVVADGRLTVAVPSTWRSRYDPWDGMSFRLDPDEWAICGIKINSFEVPEEIAADRLKSFLSDPALPEGTDYRRRGLSKRTYRFTATSERGNRQEYWRRGWSNQTYLRMATFMLQVAPDKVGTPDHARAIAHLDALVAGARFPTRILPVDRIAPSKDFKQTSVDLAVRLRVPEGWERGRDKASGWTVFAAPGGSGLSLWVQWDVFRLELGLEKTEEGMFMLLLQVAQFMPVLFGKGLEVWAYETGEVERDGRVFKTSMMGKAVSARRGLMLVRFRLEIPEEDDHSAAMMELGERLKREIKAALLSDPPDDGADADEDPAEETPTE